VQEAEGESEATPVVLTSVFEKVLNAIETRDFTDADVLSELQRLLLVTGASPVALLEILRRRKLIKPLPENTYAELLGLLNDAVERAGVLERTKHAAKATVAVTSLRDPNLSSTAAPSRTTTAAVPPATPIQIALSKLAARPAFSSESRASGRRVADPPSQRPAVEEAAREEEVTIDLDELDHVIEQPILTEKPPGRDSAAVSDLLKQSVAESAAPKRRAAWKPGVIGRALGVAGAVLALALVAWSLAHRAPAPVPVPAASPPALPSPGTVMRDCPTCPAMTVLPAGRFNQGSAPDDSGFAFAKPRHWVTIGGPFAMSTNAVTVDEFHEFIIATGRDMQGCDTYDGEWKHRPKNNWKNPGFAQTGTHPVTCASWNDAEAYARWLSTETKHRYRLPSASEWEYAARAGGEAVLPWSGDGSGACANANLADQSAAHRYPGWTVFGCDDGYVYTAPVGSFKANSFGLNDMLGNVLQWTEDCWHADYNGAPIDGSARTDGDCAERELRGGSWFTTPAYVRVDYRNHFALDYRTSSVGIRLVRDIEP